MWYIVMNMDNSPQRRLISAYHTSRSGFSLLELSIVLIIMGLLTGGVLAGRHLVRSSELKSMATQLVELNNAFNQFYDKYEYIAGDMPNATTLWGAADNADGLGADCFGVANDGSTSTCNGNGNGQIQQEPGDTFKYETWRAWQHLQNAKMLSGTYTGIAYTPSTTNREAVPGENVPAAKIESVGFTVLFKPSTVWTGWFPNNYDKHVFTVGVRGNKETRDPFLSASEMNSLDSKMDDGLPGSGSIQTWLTSSLPNCISSDDPAVSVYLTTSDDEGKACSFFYVTGF